jgi:hypothetical protein
MLIQTIVITELAFYRRQHAMIQNVFITRGPSPSHEKHPHSPPNYTVGITHAGRYRSAGIRHTKILPSNRHMV